MYVGRQYIGRNHTEKQEVVENNILGLTAIILNLNNLIGFKAVY